MNAGNKRRTGDRPTADCARGRGLVRAALPAPVSMPPAVTIAYPGVRMSVVVEIVFMRNTIKHGLYPAVVAAKNRFWESWLAQDQDGKCLAERVNSDRPCATGLLRD